MNNKENKLEKTNDGKIVITGRMAIDDSIIEEIKSLVREEEIDKISKKGLDAEEFREILLNNTLTDHGLRVILEDIVPTIIDKLDKKYGDKETHFSSDQKLHEGLIAINNILNLIRRS